MRIRFIISRIIKFSINSCKKCYYVCGINNYFIRNLFMQLMQQNSSRLHYTHKKKRKYPYLYNRFIHILIYRQDKIMLSAIIFQIFNIKTQKIFSSLITSIHVLFIYLYKSLSFINSETRRGRL